MAEKRKSFSDSRLYPIFFMVIATIIFIGILATLYQITLERVETYRELSYKQGILKLFDLPLENTRDTFAKNFNKLEKEELQYYEAVKNGDRIGYVFNISGSGLWGTITAIIAVTPDFNEIIGIDILSQNETPGLGGRITENWFKDQFKGKQVVKDGIIQTFVLKPESENVTEDQVNQITGATFSSKAVVDIIRKEMLKTTKELGLSYE